jgi:predicted ATPase/Tfp pilus assembly protein PilF
VLGTPHYMAPEIATGEPMGPAVDRYALAVIAYELVTGTVPFDAATPQSVLMLHVQQPVPAPRLANPALSPALEAVLLRGLEKAPEARYPTATAFVTALREAALDASDPTGLASPVATANQRDPIAPTARIVSAGPGANAAAPSTLASHNLPAALSSFIGRTREQDAVRTLLGAHQLVTLVGTGGTGKTRLALIVAAGWRAHCRNGVWLVELAPLSDPELIPSALSTVLGLEEEPGRPLLRTVIDYLEDKHLLLVLDNCEHLVHACAALAGDLLQRCPGLRILATSREGLGVPGEQIYRVPRLAVPDPVAFGSLNELEQVEAVRLFVTRARERQADFTLTARNAAAVAAVCARLDGLPLAIELAAGRVGSLPLEAIAAQLEQSIRLLRGGPRAMPARQQTMQAALDWSWDLLDGAERMLLGRLSVFARGWVLETAGLVCGEEDQDGWEVAELLAALVDKSLVVLGGNAEMQGRYRLLEPVRQYAAARLVEAGEEGCIHERHLDWCLALAEQGAVQLWGPSQDSWLERLEGEHDNIRAALAWSLDGERAGNEAAVKGLSLAAALARFWRMRGYFGEGRRWLNETLAHGNRCDAPAPLRARALGRAGGLARSQSDYPQARKLLEESLSLYRELDDKDGVATALNNLANVALEQGDYHRAVSLWEESLSLSRESGNKQGTSATLNNLGQVAALLDDYARASLLLEESLALSRGLGNKDGVAATLNNLGAVAAYQGDFARGGALLEESVALFQELGNKQGSADSLGELGRMAYRQGKYKRAAALHQKSLQLSQDLGARGLQAELLERLTWVAVALGHIGRAASLGGAAESLRESLDIQLVPELQADHAWAVQAIHAVLGEPTFAAAWAKGRALPIEEAITLALTDPPPT